MRFPGSARIGLYPGQSDLGYAFIRLLERYDLAWSIRTASTMRERLNELVPVHRDPIIAGSAGAP